MKRFLFGFCVAALVAMLAIGTFAAETVIYENDFSDPNTLDDFVQYRTEWEIKDGGLHITDKFTTNNGASRDTSFSHIIYHSDETLTDYIVEVDYMNIQTAGGVIFRADGATVSDNVSGFRGYLAFISNNANCGALGCAADTDAYKGNINVGKTGGCNISSNVHIKVTVKGDKIHTLITNIDNGKTVYDYTYTIGTSQSDQIWKEGTFGLRMRSGMKANDAYSAGVAYFDNLKVTTANEVIIEGGTAVVPTEQPKTSIDTSNLVPVYTNSFDKKEDITDFEQFGGTWAINDGKLYLSAKGALSHPYILYAGDTDLVSLKDYVVDVDIYNIQTQGGIIIRSDFANINVDSESGFMGYHMFTSNNGTLGAIGAGNTDGKWLEGNIKVSGAIMQPGMNVHMQAAVKGDLIQITITELETGKLLWTWCQKHDLWKAGTFGFRLRGTVAGGLDNLNRTGFDNLVVSTYGEPEETTVVKMTIGQNVGYINDEAKTLDAAPIIRESRTMLPVRFVAEAFGAEVGWDGATSTATVKTADTEIKITIGAKTAVVNGKEVALDAPAFIENGRTYMPVRFVAENLGATVAWDGVTSTATLTK